MKKKLFCTLSLSLALFAGLVSCDKEIKNEPAPAKQENNQEAENQKEEAEENEEMPAKVRLVLASGHFHGTKFHQDTYPEGLKHFKDVQEITLQSKIDTLEQNGKVTYSTKWVVAEGSDSVFKVKTLHKEETYELPMALWINYYDAKGVDITAKLVENGADKQHQHFFMPQFNQIISTENTEVFSYTYMDTDPWNKSLKEKAKLIGSKVVDTKNDINIYEPLNPIGLKGFFNFYPTPNPYLLKVTLIHTHDKFVNGKALPFNKFPKEASIEWAYVVKIAPLPDMDKVSGEFIDTDDEGKPRIVTYDGLSEEAKKYVETIAKIYHITKEEALKEIVLLINGDRNPEKGNLWL